MGENVGPANTLGFAALSTNLQNTASDKGDFAAIRPALVGWVDPGLVLEKPNMGEYVGPANTLGFAALSANLQRH